MNNPWHGGARLAPSGWRLGCGLLGCGSLACAGPAEIPELPQLTQLTREYDRPTAELQAARARQVIDSNPELERLLAALRSTSHVVDGVEDARGPAEQRTSEGVRLRGAIHVTLRCPGELARPEYDPERNGSVALTFGVEHGAILREVGGDAVQCRFAGDFAGLPLSVVLDGPIDFDLGEDIPLGQRWSRRRWLVALRGTISADGLSFGAVSARIEDGAIEHLYRLDDGSSVVLSASSSAISLRDADATWSCSKSGGTCARE